jgi:predicted nucleic acid-binding protein
VFACANAGPLGQAARQLIAATREPVTTPHALAETFNTLTYRLGIPPSEARRMVELNTSRFRFVTMEATDYQQAIARVVDNGMTGDKVYDALHLGAALKAKATKLHTSNKRDFGPFKAQIEVVKMAPSEHPPIEPAT